MVAAVELSTDCDTEATVPSADIIWPTENSLFTALLKLLVGCGTIASGALHLRWVMVGGGGRRSKASHTKVPIADLRSDVRNFWRKNSAEEQKNETLSDSSEMVSSAYSLHHSRHLQQTPTADNYHNRELP